MGFQKPFQAVPVELDSYRRRKAALSYRKRAVNYLAAAALGGIGIGIGSTALTEDGRDRISSSVKPLAVTAGIRRAREPQRGDYWRGCNDARGRHGTDLRGRAGIPRGTGWRLGRHCL